jgi:glycosyltransferase involved in cell wall biosynthesis
MVEISIITPVFNGLAYIEACLKNVIGQKCPEIEHLIMDGASTDGTVELVQKWAAEYPHIRLVSEKDAGQSDAMNKGIGLARGPIIGFLNVDDYYEPQVLNRVAELFRTLPVPSFVCGNLNIWNPDGSFRHFNRPNRLSLPELVSNRFEWPYNPTCYFYHKSIHQKTGLYNTENHFCMDYEFILSAARHVDLQYIDEVWGNFCVVESSKTFNSHTHALETARETGRNLREAAEKMLRPEEQKILEKLRKEIAPLFPAAEKPQKQTLRQRVKNWFR